jgi:hypothetical protein
MSRGLEVDVPEVRRCASGLAGTGARVATGAGGMPEAGPDRASGAGGMPEVVPDWATSEAAASAGEAARRRLAVVGADIAATARQIIAAVVDYEAADERAATRLRGAR